MIKRIFLILCILFCCTVCFAQVKVITSSFEQGLALAKQQNKLLIVNCTSPGG